MISKTEKDSTEQIILAAATKIFTQKGYAAARMEDIAKEAGINRALLHYYFRSKEKMFEIIFEEKFRDFFKGVWLIVGSSVPLFDKIRAIIDHEITTLSKHPDLPLFIVSEVARDPELLLERFARNGFSPFAVIDNLNTQVQEAVASGLIKPITGYKLLMNIMGVCIYPFMVKGMVSRIMNQDEAELISLLESRKDELADFVINGIKA
jgi:AcrR family transcriptional regulator